jgi:L-lysine exporter family protein LysE/ArgO
MSQILIVAAAGFGMGLSLIVAIGAQNAFVLRQGIRGEAVPLVVLICAASDAALIGAGVSGMGAVVDSRPGVLTAVGMLGGGFLLGYGVPDADLSGFRTAVRRRYGRSCHGWPIRSRTRVIAG